MEFSIRRTKALVKKEGKSLFKNANVLFMCILPIIFSIIYSYILVGNYGDVMTGKIEVLIMCLSMNLVLVGSYVIAMLIAEEKEKNTMRNLMFAGVTSLEFLTGKVIISFLLTEVTNIIIFLIMGIDIGYLAMFILLTTLVSFSLIELGAVIGIISPNQMSTGFIGMPVLLFFLLIPLFADMNDTFKNIAKVLPNYNMNVLLRNIFRGNGLGTDNVFSIVVILLWILIAFLCFAVTYKKVGLDK